MDETRRGGGRPGERLKKVYKRSHLVCESSSSSPLSATTASVALQRHPVITDARAPKVIHTSPSSFMELVQKLTGLPPRSAARHHEQSTGSENSHRDGSDSTVLQNCFASGNDGRSCMSHESMSWKNLHSDSNSSSWLHATAMDKYRFNPMMAGIDIRHSLFI